MLAYQSLDEQKTHLAEQPENVHFARRQKASLEQRLACILGEKNEIERLENRRLSPASDERTRRYYALDIQEADTRKELDLLTAELQNCGLAKEQSEANILSLNNELEKIRLQFEENGMTGLINLYDKLKEHNRFPPVVPVKDGYCTGCNIALHTGKMCELRRYDKIVTHEQQCGRILYLDKKHVRRLPITVHQGDLDHRTITVPIQMINRDRLRDKFKFRDFWNTDWDAIFRDGKLHDLDELMIDKYRLQDGDQVYLSEIDAEDNHYRIECDILSDHEYHEIADVLERTKDALNLEKFITSHLTRRAVIFGPAIVLNKLRQKLHEDKRFKQVGDKWIAVKYLQPVGKPQDLEPITTGKDVRERTEEQTNVCRFKLTPPAIDAGEFYIGPALRSEFQSLPEEAPVRVLAYARMELPASVHHNPLRLKGLTDFYAENNLKDGDIVFLEKMEQEFQTTYKVYTRWECQLVDLLFRLQKARNETEESEILKNAPDLPLRYLIYLILSRSGNPMHYKDIHSRVNKSRVVRIQSVEATLSKYNKRLFFTDGKGNWGLCEWPHEELPEKTSDEKDSGTGPAPVSQTIDEDEIMRQIAGNDMVYDVLRSANTPLSTSEICGYLSKRLGIDQSVLEKLTFINANDERLVRRPDGRWALKEWFECYEEAEEVPLASEFDGPEPLTIPAEDATTVFAESAQTREDNSLVWVILMLFLLLLGAGALAAVLLLIMK